MMAQNRDAERDRLVMQEDYETNRRAAEEVRKILDTLEQHGRFLAKLVELLLRPAPGRPTRWELERATRVLDLTL
jgi:uncharacterized membrane protein